MASSEVTALFERALIGLDDEEQSNSDLVTGRRAIRELHRLVTVEALETALRLCTDLDSLQRRVVAAVLGQLGHAKVGCEPVFLVERFDGLAGLLDDGTRRGRLQ